MINYDIDMAGIVHTFTNIEFISDLLDILIDTNIKACPSLKPRDSLDRIFFIEFVSFCNFV